jgi:hypothetical protein
MKKTNFNVRLSQFGYPDSTNIIDIPKKELQGYYNQSVDYMYKNGILKTGDKYSVKDNRYSFTIIRYRK